MIRRAGWERVAGIAGLSALAVLVVLSFACKAPAERPEAGAGQAAEGQAATTPTGVQEGVNELSGTVKSALGAYFYLPQVPGFDFVVTGPVSGGDATSLIDKEVKVKGLFQRDHPNILVAQSIDVKTGENQFQNVYASSDNSVPADLFDQKARAEYVELAITNINKAEDWEGKAKAKVSGKLLAAEGEPLRISVLGADGKEVGKIIVDSKTSYSDYYIKKLRLFDTFYFYLNVKESVARNLRAKAKEIFHADLVFAGLY